MKILKNLFGAFIALFAFLALSATVFAAAPAVPTHTFVDTDANGTIDKITITYNQVIATCTATSADFTYSSSTIGGTLGAVSCTGVDANVSIAVTSANTGVTGTATAPTLAYTDSPAREISNAGAEQVATYGVTEIVDGAQPIVLSIGTKDVFTVNGKIDALKVTFTENIDDSLTENYACGTSYTTPNLAVADATGEAIVCGGIISGDATDDPYLYISITEVVGTCSFDSQVGCTGDMTTTDVTWTGGGAAIKIGDLTGNYTPTLTTGMIAEADTAAPVLLGAKTYDSDTDGKVDHMRLMFSENIDDSLIAGYSGVTCPGDVSYTATSLAVANVTGEKVQCPTVAPPDLTDNNELQIVFSETSSTCTYLDQTGCDTDIVNQDITWTAASILIKDLAGNLAADLVSGGITEADGAGPVVMSGATQDSDGDGKVDHLKLTFSEAIDDSLMSNYSAVADYTPSTLAVAVVTGEAVDYDADAVDNDVLYVGFTEDATGACDPTAQTGCDTDEVDQDITWTGASATIADAAGNNTANVSSATILEFDSSSPVLVKVVASTSSGANTIAFTYSEAVTVTNGASSATCGDLTTAGTFAGLGTFGTGGNLTVATTKNTVAGSGTDTVTVTLANQSGGYLVTSTSATITVPSGTITGSAAAGVVDANSNQVKTSAPAVTATTLPSAAWDVTRPTITAASLSDIYTNDSNLIAGGTFTSGSDNRPDAITLTASETLKTITDASTTRDDWGITAPAFGTLAVVKAAASGTTYTANFSGANETYSDAGQFDLLNTQDSVPSFVDQAGNPLASGLTSETYKLCYTGYSCTGGTIANSAIIGTTLSARPSTGGGTILFSTSRSTSRTTTEETTDATEDATKKATTETAEEETSRETTTKETTEPATETTRETPTYAREESYDRYSPSEATSTELTREATTETTTSTETPSERVERVREILGVAEQTAVTEVVSRAIETITADTADADSDGITNAEEATRGTSSYSADSDGDGEMDSLDPAPADASVVSETWTELSGALDRDSNSNGMSNRAEYLFGAETTSRELVFGSANGDINLGLSQIAFVTPEGFAVTGTAKPNTRTRIGITLNDGSTISTDVETDANGIYIATFDSAILKNVKADDLLLITSEKGKEVLAKVTNETIKRPEVKIEGSMVEETSAENNMPKYWSTELVMNRIPEYINQTSFKDGYLKGREKALENEKPITVTGYTEPNSAVMFVFKSATFSSVVISDKDGYFEMEVPKELKDELSQNADTESMLHEFIGFSVDYKTNKISPLVKGLFRIYNWNLSLKGSTG